MAPDQDVQTGTESSASSTSMEASRPARRSRRGHRGRGRHHRPRPPRKEGSSFSQETGSNFQQGPPAETDAPQADAQAREPLPSGDVETAPLPLRELPSPAATPQRRGQSESVSKGSIEGAINQVNEIIASLKDSLEQMDEVLELLEHFERQGDADERELESLRRALRQLQRPRESGHHPHRGQS